MVDMPLQCWLKIFLAFQIEHLQVFPKDTLSMLGHMDQVIKMKMTGMQWQKYDMLVRQKRGKKIPRGSEKVGSCATTYVILYLECQQPRPATKTHGAKLGEPETLHGALGKPHPLPTPGKGSSRDKEGQAATIHQWNPTLDRTCWKFKSTKGCDGACLWLYTHECYYCGAEHATKDCHMLVGAATNPPKHHSLFLPLKVLESRSGQQEERIGTIGRCLV